MSDLSDVPSRPPCVMLSSTFYDLRQIRDYLRRFLEDDLGFRALTSEHASFPIDPDATTIENCRRRVERDADVLVLIIGRRYGTIDKATATSITNVEYLAARKKRIPVYAFVESGLLALLPVWRLNPGANFSTEVDTPQLFEFVEQVRTRDNVWMREFLNAPDIVDALRIQFAYQHHRGVRLERQFLGVSDFEWFGTLRGDALRIAIERPDMWEYLLFATALRDAVNRHRRLRRRHELKLPSGLGEDVHDPMTWILARFSDCGRMAAVCETVINGPLQEGLGPPGMPGDVETIAFCAEAIGDLYRDALLWSARLRTANVPDLYEQLMLRVADMASGLIGEIEKFGPDAKVRIEDALARHRPGEKQVVDLTMTIGIPEETMRAFNEELDRVRRAGG